MHPRTRMSIVSALKDSYKKYLPVKLPVLFPIKIKMEVYRIVESWDIDNFQIFYFKTFLDSLKDNGLVPDDSVRYITGTESEFYPITDDESRKLVFIISEDKREVIHNHIWYKNNGASLITRTGSAPWTILVNDNLNSGKLFIDHDKKIFYIGIGKKHIIWGALRKVLNSIAYNALILNTGVQVSPQMYEICGPEIEKFLLQSGVPVYIGKVKELDWTIKLFEKVKQVEDGQ